MRLLFDENLSPDLPRILAAAFPLSAHVRDLKLIGADDSVLWNHAANEGYTLVTKDDDFEELSILRGAPPKVVLIKLGNCRTEAVATLLASSASALERFLKDSQASLLELP